MEDGASGVKDHQMIDFQLDADFFSDGMVMVAWRQAIDAESACEGKGL